VKRAAPFVITTLIAVACVDPVSGPGDEVMGNFEFTADLEAPPSPDAGAPEVPRCEYTSFQDAFTFNARFARFRDAGDGNAVITIGFIDRDAGFDGQVLTGTKFPDEAKPAHVFAPVDQSCTCSARVTETLTVAVLSTSQSTALGNNCPDHPLDGGLPAPLPDGGIRLPDTTPTGFDAVRACGELVDVVEVDEATRAAQPDCNCQERCAMRYVVRGVRR
jgi:hypothetical protein